MSHLEEALEHLSQQLDTIDGDEPERRSGDRFVGSGASADYAERIARGGTAHGKAGHVRVVEQSTPTPTVGGDGAGQHRDFAQKVSTVFKVAGTSHLSDELLADSNGAAAELVSRQFAQQIAISIDQAIISGTGTGQPTGIRGTAGVTSTAVSGQTGNKLYESIVSAIGRLAVKFFTEEISVVLHPRDAVKFPLAVDGANNYIFANVDLNARRSSSPITPRPWPRRTGIAPPNYATPGARVRRIRVDAARRAASSQGGCDAVGAALRFTRKAGITSARPDSRAVAQRRVLSPGCPCGWWT